MAVVGFDDVALGEIIDPDITVFSQDPYGLGPEGAKLPFSQIGGYLGEGRRVELPTRLVPRGSWELAPAEVAA